MGVVNIQLFTIYDKEYIPLVVSHYTMGRGVQYTMGRGFNISVNGVNIQ